MFLIYYTYCKDVCSKTLYSKGNLTEKVWGPVVWTDCDRKQPGTLKKERKEIPFRNGGEEMRTDKVNKSEEERPGLEGEGRGGIWEKLGGEALGVGASS